MTPPTTPLSQTDLYDLQTAIAARWADLPPESSYTALTLAALDLLQIPVDALPDNADPADVADVLFDTRRSLPNASFFLLAGDLLEQVL